jgi:hypothetical protein
MACIDTGQGIAHLRSGRGRCVNTAIPSHGESRWLKAACIPITDSTRPAPIAQIAEGKPVSAAEVLEWCGQPRRFHEAPLREFVELLNSHIEFRASTAWADYQNRKMKLPRPGPTLDLAYVLRRDLDTLRGALGDGFWQGLGAPLGGMEQLGAALAELGPFLRARPRGRRGGRRPEWHEFAALYAVLIADILHEPGGKRPSLFNPDGRVAAAGAKAIRHVFERRTPLLPRAFAAAVRGVLRGMGEVAIRRWRERRAT